MRFGSLFTGIGGFDLGLERAGMTCAWQCEIDPACRKVLARHFPGVPCFEDVKELYVERGSVDLICGGFPCQDLSVAGRRAGLAGERSGLWHEFHRVLTAARPQWCVIENVPGLLSSRKGNDFAVVLRGLVELGYGVCWRVLDAQYFGVAQRRRRVFIVGHLGDGRAAEVLFEPESLPGNPPARGKAGEAVAGTLGGGSAERGWPDDTDRMTFVPVTSPALKARDYKGPSSDGDGDGAPLVVHALTAEGHDASEDGTGRGTPLVTAFQPRFARNGRGGPSDVAYPLTAETGRTGKGDSAQVMVIQDASMPREKKQNGIGIQEGGPMYTLDGHGAHAVAFAQNQRGEFREPTVAPPLTTGGGKPGQGYPACTIGMAVRRLMPVECERLQGFPDCWTDGHADGPRYRMLGNAVAVPVAEWIGRRIVEAG